MVMKQRHLFNRIYGYYTGKAVNQTGITAISYSASSADTVFSFSRATAIWAQPTLPFARRQFFGIFGGMVAFMLGIQNIRLAKAKAGACCCRSEDELSST
jgi:hypothetical protein